MSKVKITGELTMKFTVEDEKTEFAFPIETLKTEFEKFPELLREEMIREGMTTCEISNFSFTVVEE